ncbi:MAG: hypothetical protein K0R92_1393 [Lachnospiraceae bacterium]|nr:hypothetical protein [Lachnospiraceae bacterium]
MLQKLFDQNLFIYIMLGLGALGIIVKLILQIKYALLVKASDNMGTSKNKLTQTMKMKFESCYKLKIGVNNVDIFVDKHVYRHKFCGLYLSTWENIGGQVLILNLLIGSISSILGLIYECGKQQILGTFSVGIIIGGMLIFIDGLINIPGKKQLIRINMKDYLENLYKVRLEHPEMFEQYKEQVEGEAGEQGLKRAPKALSRAERAMLKSEARARLKQEKKYAKLQKKEAVKARRKLAYETRERMKKEEKLAIERKREADRLELEQRRVEARAEEQRKKEDKIRQEEIRKALLLEKKAAKEGKNKKPGEHLTIAQARKESLKKEIRDRREHKNYTRTEAESEIEHNPNIEMQNQTTREAANQPLIDTALNESVSIMQEKIAVALEEVTSSEVKENKPNRTDSAGTHGSKSNSVSLVRAPKKTKQLDYLEEKIIADTLKEFLA